jgi:hypothetical protein
MDDQTLYHLFDSLKNEVDAVRRDFQPVRDGIQRIEARLDRQGGIINGGARQVARLVTWSEEIDAMLAERDGRIAALEHRLERLEGK